MSPCVFLKLLGWWNFDKKRKEKKCKKETKKRPKNIVKDTFYGIVLPGNQIYRQNDGSHPFDKNSQKIQTKFLK